MNSRIAVYVACVGDRGGSRGPDEAEPLDADCWTLGKEGERGSYRISRRKRAIGALRDRGCGLTPQRDTSSYSAPITPSDCHLAVDSRLPSIAKDTRGIEQDDGLAASVT